MSGGRSIAIPLHSTEARTLATGKYETQLLMQHMQLFMFERATAQIQPCRHEGKFNHSKLSLAGLESNSQCRKLVICLDLPALRGAGQRSAGTFGAWA